jgi:hypothetical protein
MQFAISRCRIDELGMVSSVALGAQSMLADTFAPWPAAVKGRSATPEELTTTQPRGRKRRSGIEAI